MIETIEPATPADLARVEEHRAAVLGLLRDQSGVAAFAGDEHDLDAMQRLLADGRVGPDDEAALESLGVAFGHLATAFSPLEWVTVEYERERRLALNYPFTTVLVFPGWMIAKRVRRGEAIDLRGLLAGLLEQVEEMKDDPELRRDPNFVSPVGDPDKLDIIAKRKDGGVDLILVVAGPLDASGDCRRVFATKLRNYCRYAASEAFAAEFGSPEEIEVRVVVRSDWEVPEELIRLMGEIADEEEAPVRLQVRYE